MTVHEAALAWHDAGFAVLPTKVDGSKAPAVLSWTGYQRERPGRGQVDGWFAAGHPGIGLLTGAVSGNLEMLELEGRAVAEGALQEVTALLTAAGLADLWVRVTAGGYAEKTPSGGLHLLYRVAGDVPGNTKLANRPARDDELTDAEREILTKSPQRVIVRGLAETRGEGGYVVIAPSHGSTHPTGQPWTVAYGQAGIVPTLALDEREQLLRVFRCLDKMPAVEQAPARPALQVVRDGGDVSPGDDFEARVDWADDLLLGGAGWRSVAQFPSGYRTWRRPGKDTPGISATTGRRDDRDRLFVFSSATEFQAETPYTKLGAFAVLHHGGDHSAAARDLRRRGFGTPAPLSPDPAAEQRAALAELVPDQVPPASTAARTLHAVDGTAARVLAEGTPDASRFGPTQDGLARALVAHHGDVLRYCPQRGKWLAWDGHRWAWDDAGAHREHIRTLARSLPDADGWARFKASALSARGVSGVADLARSDAAVVVDYDRLDADPWALNTPDGIVDLRTGKLGRPDPGALCTRSTSCAPDPAADTARWAEFLTDTFGEDDGLVAYLRRLVGYSAVGMVGPHVLPFAFGSGGNGKGVFLEAIAGVLGQYATSAPVGFLMAQMHSGHETEIARLAGARMVICSEVNEDDRFDEARVKQLTGGDSLTARFMRQDHFTFTPTHQLWLMGNAKPSVRAGGRSFWRRLRLLPFEHEVPEEKIVDDLQGILVREHGPAILQWIAAGAAEYHSAGLREPDSVKAATDEYAKDQDTIARFVAERCRIGGGAQVKVKVGDVREAYEIWCRSEGEEPKSAKRLGMDLEKRFGVIRERTPGARMYGNVSLWEAENASSDASSDASWVRDEQGGW